MTNAVTDPKAAAAAKAASEEIAIKVPIVLDPTLAPRVIPRFVVVRFPQPERTPPLAAGVTFTLDLLDENGKVIGTRNADAPQAVAEAWFEEQRPFLIEKLLASIGAEAAAP